MPYGRHRYTRNKKNRFAKANERRTSEAAERTEDAEEIVEDTENLAEKVIDAVADGAKGVIDVAAEAAKAVVGQKADEVLEYIPKLNESTESSTEVKVEAPVSIEDFDANSPAKADISEKAVVAKDEPKKAKKAPAKKKAAKKKAAKKKA